MYSHTHTHTHTHVHTHTHTAYRHQLSGGSGVHPLNALTLDEVHERENIGHAPHSPSQTNEASDQTAFNKLVAVLQSSGAIHDRPSQVRLSLTHTHTHTHYPPPPPPLNQGHSHKQDTFNLPNKTFVYLTTSEGIFLSELFTLI